MPQGNGHAGEFVQRSLFENLSEAQLLLVLKQIVSAIMKKIEHVEQAVIKILNYIMGGAPLGDKEFYTPNEFALIVGLEPDTVRSYLKEERIIGTQDKIGRGGKPVWRISRDELKHFQNNGLREAKWKYRHPK